MESPRRLLGQKQISALAAVPVALLLAVGCFQLLDEGDSAEESARRAPAPRVALQPVPRQPAAPALVPEAPPVQVPKAGPDPDMTFADWKQKRIARQEWEQKQRERAIHQARQEQRPAWLDKNVFALSKELQELDRLTAQRVLASRFPQTKPNSPERVALHQVDHQLGLEAWKLHVGGVQQVAAWAGQKTEPRHSLEPNQVQAYARRRQRRLKRKRRRQALAQ